MPTLQDGDFLLWESNTIVRHLAREHSAGTLEPADPKMRARASQWMDWQLSVVGPAIFAAFWGLIRTPEDKRDHAAIATSQAKTTDAMKILDAQLGKTAFVAGEQFSMGDIPVGVMAYRFRQLCPDRPALNNLERWYGALQKRPAFKEHVEFDSAELERLAAQQLWHFAGQPRRFADEEILQRAACDRRVRGRHRAPAAACRSGWRTAG